MMYDNMVGMSIWNRLQQIQHIFIPIFSVVSIHSTQKLQYVKWKGLNNAIKFSKKFKNCQFYGKIK